MKYLIILSALMFSVLLAYPAGSMEKKINSRERTATAVFAGGCFWSVENKFEQLDGVISAVSGFTGGKTENPTYKEVCGGTTGHAEAVKVTYSPDLVTFEELVRFFFTSHDFTHSYRQNSSFMSQYRAAVYFSSEQEKRTIEKIISELTGKGYTVYTEVSEAAPFWPAEEYHQDYIKKQEKGEKP